MRPGEEVVKFGKAKAINLRTNQQTNHPTNQPIDVRTYSDEGVIESRVKMGKKNYVFKHD